MHDYNIVSSYTGTTASAHESTPANAAALFVDAAGGDLRLAAVTPPVAVDKGVATLGGKAAPTTDVLGAPRPAGAGYDIGAYEFGSVAPPTGAGGAAGSGGAGGSSGTGGNVGSRGGAGGASAMVAMSQWRQWRQWRQCRIDRRHGRHRGLAGHASRRDQRRLRLPRGRRGRRPGGLPRVQPPRGALLHPGPVSAKARRAPIVVARLSHARRGARLSKCVRRAR